jgi:hypothetical protein
MKANPEFKAIYNPYTRQLLVSYGDTVTEYFFQDVEEWVKISFNGDENHPNYLHIQLDYDECMQLIFYPRVDGSDSLHEAISTQYNTCDDDNPDNITIIHNEEQLEEAKERIFGLKYNQTTIE